MTRWTCAVCGKSNPAGLGMWACHSDEDTTPVHIGRCFRQYKEEKRAAEVEVMWNEAIARWSNP